MRFSRRLVVVLCVMFLAVFAAQSILPEHYSVMNTAEAAGKIKLNKKKATITAGDTLQLEVIGTTEKVKWSSSDKKVAAVNKKGLVTGKKEGTATITARVGKKKLTCKLTVKKLILKVHKDEAEVTEGGKTQVKVTYTEAGTIHWDSSDESVVTCKWQGKWTNHGNDTLLYIYGHKPGTVTITISVKPQKKSVKLRVTVKESPKWDSDSANTMLEWQKAVMSDLTDASTYAMKAYTTGDSIYNTYARTSLAKAGVNLVKCVSLAAKKDDVFYEGKSFKTLLNESYALYQAIGSSLTGLDLSNAIMEANNVFLDAMTVFAANVASFTD